MDETPTRRVYEDIARFLNTREPVAVMGVGVGLEVGNSIYFDMPADQFSYWNTDDSGRAMVQALIRSGHIDFFHSYGDFATTRAHAERSLSELSLHGCSIGVWVDHAVAVTNFGPDIMRGAGDVPGHPAYHADLTLAHGVRYIWRGRVTSVVGQDVPRGFAGVFERSHPVASTRTVAKEWTKGVVARFGNAKYAMHASNDLIRPVRLRDGNETWEFCRSNPYWRSVTLGTSADGFGHVVTKRVLDTLCARGGATILYTHLGKVSSPDEPLPPHTRGALKRLADYQSAGKILVTTTRRLLDHALARRAVAVDVQASPGASCTVALECPGSWLQPPLGDPRSAVSGLTVYVPSANSYQVTVNGRAVTSFTTNPPDETGRPTVSLPWPRLRFPSLPS